jgi:hypothetical protein
MGASDVSDTLDDALSLTGFGYLPSSTPSARDDRLTGMMPGLSSPPMTSRNRRKPISGYVLVFAFCSCYDLGKGSSVLDNLLWQVNKHLMF